MNFVKLVNNTRKFQAVTRMLSTPYIASKNISSAVIINNPFNNMVSIATVNRCSFEFERNFSSTELIDSVTFEKVCSETLESLSEYFEELVEDTSHLKDADVSYSSGVLTINFGQPYGTYVINRQSPNRQIWLSSPTSGPKRYDFYTDQNTWIYKHDNISLHQLLQNEIKEIVKKEVNFAECSYSFVNK